MEVSPHELNASYTTAGEFRVHRAGCRDIARQSNNWDANYGDMRDPRAIAIDLWSDIINEGGMTEDEAEDNVTYLPCCEFQQVPGADEDSAKNLEEVVDADANGPYTEVVGQDESKTETRGVTMNATDTLVEYTASLQTIKTTDLRKMAAKAGIKTVGENETKVNAGRKADLIDALTALKAEELEQAAKAEAPKAKKAAKKAKAAKTSEEKADDNALKIRTARKFVAEAEAKGWAVKIDNQMATEQGDIVIIEAAKGDETITLRWIDGAYDYYQGGSFHTDANGKARKILNTSAAINRYL